uniref:Calpain catalytic domain-containing protein n=1 Tax=Angiostrongylus cantonensis TaxID=6313 RepID=A0A158P9N1_ANGCA
MVNIIPRCSTPFFYFSDTKIAKGSSQDCHVIGCRQVSTSNTGEEEFADVYSLAKGLCFKGENNLVYTEYKGSDFWTKTMAYVGWLRTKFFILGAETSLAMGTEDLIKGGHKVFFMILDAVLGRKLDTLAPLTLGRSVLDIHRKLVWSLVERQKCALSVTNDDFVGVNGFVYNWDGFATERGTLARLIHSTTFVSHDAAGEVLDKPYFKYSIILAALLRKNELYKMASYQVRQLPFNFNEDRMLLRMPADYGFITPRYVVVRIDMCHEVRLLKLALLYLGACMSFLEDSEEPFRVRASVQQSAARPRRRGDLGTSENPIVLCPSPVQPVLAADLSVGRTQSVSRMTRRKCPLGAYVEVVFS